MRLDIPRISCAPSVLAKGDRRTIPRTRAKLGGREIDEVSEAHDAEIHTAEVGAFFRDDYASKIKPATTLQ